MKRSGQRIGIIIDMIVNALPKVTRKQAGAVARQIVGFLAGEASAAARALDDAGLRDEAMGCRTVAARLLLLGSIKDDR